MHAQPIFGEGRDQRARQDIGRQHGEADRLRQRHEQVTRDAVQEEHRHEHDADAQRRHQRRDGDLARAVQDGFLDFFPLLEMRVDALDRDGRIVDQDADGEHQPAQGHDVDRLAEQRQANDRTQDREWDRDRDDER